MYRILKCTKDTYIQNFYINGTSSIDANVGNASTIDLSVLVNEKTLPNGSGSGIELSRGLLKFDLQPLYDLTSSILNINHSSFKATLKLFDIYGGQTVPSNYTLNVFPLAKAFDEGRGYDILAFRDIDAANFISASISSGLTLWDGQGCSISGGLGNSNIDYYTSGNLGNGIESFEKKQVFERGDENLSIDITTLISGTLSNQIPNHGFRLAFTSSQETDGITRFVKRFATRHVNNPRLKPVIIIQYNDAIIDDNQMLYFDTNNNLYFYNNFRGSSRNFFSGSTEITGSDSLLLTLVASQSIKVLTSSFQSNFSASVSYYTSATLYHSQSFTGSQFSIGNTFITGTYHCPFTLSSSLINFIGPSSSLSFAQYWQSLDGTITYATGNYLQINKIIGGNNSFQERNIVCNITNLKNYYTTTEIARLRVFTIDYNTEVISYRIPQTMKPTVFKQMYWRLLDAFSREILIDFDTESNSTLLSCDAGGHYFDLYMEDLVPNFVYEIEFLINENGKNIFLTNNGFRFKVIK